MGRSLPRIEASQSIDVGKQKSQHRMKNGVEKPPGGDGNEGEEIDGSY